MSRIKIEVSQNDIQYGRRQSSRHCPIARSLARQFNMPMRCVSVGPLDADMVTETHDIWIKLPIKAQRFIELFDSGKEVKPMTFNVTAEASEL